MKRDNDSSDGPPNKFRRNDSATCLRVLIPSKAAGPIIGKSGETIKKLRNQFSVRLHIPDSRGPERVFYLEGEIPSICGCLKELSPQFLDVLSAKNADQRLFNSRDGDDSKCDVDPERCVDVRILIHESQVGSVIGKGGERIKELKNDNNLHLIKIYQEVAPGSTDRVVQLIGEPEDVCNCIQGVMDTLEASPIRGPRSDYDANFSEQAPMPYGQPGRYQPEYDDYGYGGRSAPPPPTQYRGYDNSRNRGYDRRPAPPSSGYYR